ncbi:cytidylate kinase [Colletotrichum tabaci]|uniref:Cytidylate kinase n=1 Tax=Colletotrichum tabaci TaxID=1209068 RepID=A0AAV9TJI7_9PEZI
MCHMPCQNPGPTPRVLQNQLDQVLEEYIVTQERVLLNRLHEAIFKKKTSSTLDVLLTVVLLLKVVEKHIWRLLYWVRHDRKLRHEDENKAVLMCLIHDIGEITAGDITPADGVDPERKHLEERLGLTYLSYLLKASNPYWASRILGIWHEYESGVTRVAQLVRQVDKLECLHQAFIFLKRYKGQRKLEATMKDFKDLRKKISDPWLSAQADFVLADWALLEKKEQQRSPGIVFVIGGPGVGKGTLCARITENFNFAHVSVGDLLREEQNNPESRFGDFIRESIQNSVIVPPPLTMMLLKDKVEAIQSQNKGVLIDGFPRSIDQAVAFEQET